jgi:hypothetical protein
MEYSKSSPRRNAAIDAHAVSTSRLLDWSVAHAVCGVTKHLGCAMSAAPSESFRGGSSARTSRYAAASPSLLLSAARRAPSSTMGPLAVLIKQPVWKSKFYGAFVLNRRVVLHAIDATPARWRGDAGSSPLERARTAAPSPRGDLVKNCRVPPTHWLISTQKTTARFQSTEKRRVDEPFGLCRKRYM